MPFQHALARVLLGRIELAGATVRDPHGARGEAGPRYGLDARVHLHLGWDCVVDGQAKNIHFHLILTQ